MKELQGIVINILAYLNGGIDVKNDQEATERKRQMDEKKNKKGP